MSYLCCGEKTGDRREVQRQGLIRSNLCLLLRNSYCTNTLNTQIHDYFCRSRPQARTSRRNPSESLHLCCNGNSPPQRLNFPVNSPAVTPNRTCMESESTRGGCLIFEEFERLKTKQKGMELIFTRKQEQKEHFLKLLQGRNFMCGGC